MKSRNYYSDTFIAKNPLSRCRSTKYDDLKYSTKTVVPSKTVKQQTGTKVIYKKCIPKGSGWKDGYDFIEITEDEFRQIQKEANTTEDCFTFNGIYYSKYEEPI